MKRLKSGDTFKLELNKDRFCLMQFLEFNPEEGYIVRIQPPCKTDSDYKESLTLNELFFAKVYLREGIRRSECEFIGNFDIPPDYIFPRFWRMDQLIGSTKGKWKIRDVVTKSFIIKSDLDKEEETYSPDGYWDVGYLIEKLNQGFRLDNWIPI